VCVVKEIDMNTGLEIAVIGMTGRFPGAKNIDEFWRNLKNGVESITFFSDQELRAAGVDTGLLKNPNYVKARGILDGIEYFDAAFFDYTSKEAEVMDPQFRIFHECVWEALEAAGYNPESYEGVVGIYAGNTFNPRWMMRVLNRVSNPSEKFEANTLYEGEFLNTRISYKLGLNGPSFTVQTACSTSLVAIHLACQGLLNGECNVALAGGVTISNIENSGYLYQEGMIASPDGHCRAFDARAKGTVGGDGLGVVALKCLEDAFTEGDCIQAVIKSSAINNDGNRKVNYTAPSTIGQAAVIGAVQRLAEVGVESIGYVETHGTGTALGDPVEIEALKRAFPTDKRGYCGLGSIKTNVGHLGAAAGVAGFIKTVLALKYRLIPPSLHFESPNPGIDFENSPFYVNTELKEWKHDGCPLRAGVSSFGIGGTNAHVVLEEAPEIEESSPGRHWKLMVLSARTESALNEVTGNLAGYFKKNPDINLSDAAYTLQVGRKPFQYRRISVCRDVKEAIEALSSPDSGKIQEFSVKEGKKPIIFMFPGQGSQYVEMGLGLYQTESLFREELDRCFGILEPLMGYDIKEILYPGAGRDERHLSIDQTEVAQVVLFIFEYALAKLLMKWGITPHAMIGHSIGEYTAACLSGVFSLEDALKLVAARGQLMQQLPGGSMLSVPLPGDELKPMLSEKLSLAAVNSSSLCVISGSHEDIDGFEKVLKERGCEGRRLHTSHAFHSTMIEPVLGKFEEKVREIKLSRPDIPYISNLTGSWIAAEDAVEPGYWARHLRETVRFGDGVSELLKEDDSVFIEMGPGKVLSMLVRRHSDKGSGHMVVDLIRHPQEKVSDQFHLLGKIGQLWLYGQTADWPSFYSGESRHRLSLPTYPFERKRYWIKEGPFNFRSEMSPQTTLLSKKPAIRDWFYIPSWRRTSSPVNSDDESEICSNYLLLIDDCGMGQPLGEALKKKGHRVIIVQPGDEFLKVGNHLYQINPGKEEDYLRLLAEIHWNPQNPHRIIHGWNVSRHEEGDIDSALDLGFYSLLYLARALGRQEVGSGNHKKVQIMVVSNRMQAVDGQDSVEPLKAVSRGAVRVVPREYPGITCRSIDFDELSLEQLLNEIEITGEGADMFTAYRGEGRWVETFEPAPQKESRTEAAVLKERGVYLITGGLGGIGLVLAGYLATTCKARLILTGRSAFPGRERWDEWLLSHGREDETARKIGQIRDMEAAGAEVLVVRADAADEAAMRQAAARAEERFGPVNGIIHSAGTADAGLIHHRTGELSQTVLAPKVKGTLVLDAIFGSRGNGNELDFFLLCSSLSSVLAPVGQVAYCAANAFLDAFAYKKAADVSTYTVSVNWDTWQEVGMAVRAAEQLSLKRPGAGDEFKDAIQPEEGVEVFKRVLGLRQGPQVLISTTDLSARIDRSLVPLSQLGLDEFYREDSMTETPRPELPVPYVAAGTDTERMLVRLWQAFLGIKPVGIHDDFFELGGDSLKAMTVIANIHKELNVRIALPEFFNSPTIRGLSKYIRKFSESKYSSIEPVEKKEYYELSSAQKRLYVLQQMERESKAYNLVQVLMLEGVVEGERFERTFAKLVERYESLRTSFEMVEEEPVQRIHDKVEFEVEYDDLEMELGGRCSSELQHFSPEVENAIHRFVGIFDLHGGPLFRVGLIKVSGLRYLLMVDMHHIIADGVSLALFVKDFMALYRGGDLSPLKIQYRDFSRWQNREKTSEAIKKQEKYWLEELAGEMPVLNLPSDYKRPLLQSFEGERMPFDIGGEGGEPLKKLAVEAGATLYMVLLALFGVLLSKLSGQEEIVIGTPTAGRGHAELQQIIGMFVNTLVLVLSPGGEKTFREFLGEVRQTALTAFENQGYQFEDLVDQIAVNRDLSRNPLFDVMFVFQNVGMSKIEIPGLVLKPYEYDGRVSKFDLTLAGNETEDGLLFSFEYCVRLFKAETVEKFRDYFRTIVSDVLENPGKKLSEIEIISEMEKNLVLYEFNNTETEYPQDQTIHGVFGEQVERVPDNIAVIYRDETLTYRELQERTGELAGVLRGKGIKPGVIVGIRVERSIGMIVGILAILKAGGAYLPIDPGYPEGRIHYMLADSAAPLLVTQHHFIEKRIGDCEAIDVVCTDSYKGGRENLAGVSNLSSADELAYIIYTSGSTGRPKGVLVEHGSVMNILLTLHDIYPLLEGDLYLLKTPYMFDVSVTELFGWFIGGGSLSILEKDGEKDPYNILAEIERAAVTHINFVPSMFGAFLDILENGGVSRLSNLRYIFLAGEALLPLDVERFQDLNIGIGLENIYGPTEATIYASRYSLGDWSGGFRIPIGRPLNNVGLHILDRYNNVQPMGIAGELYISGVGVARGYLNRPELAAEKFVDGGVLSNSILNREAHKLYRTGDLARWLPGGDIEFLGRLDEQVKIRGYRVELAEIEKQLLKHEAVDEAAVVAREDAASTNTMFLSAYIVSDKEFAVPELRQYLSSRLPGYMIPSYFFKMDKLPRTPGGKLDRKSLPELDGFRPNLEVAFVAPQNNLEIIIAGIWREVLKLDQVGVHDNFFELGGNSLRLITVHTRLKKVFEKEISVVDMLRYPTISSLSEHLGREEVDVSFFDSSRSDIVKRGKRGKKQRLQKRKELRNGL
jgi:iturin family lipopeptide synthetase A